MANEVDRLYERVLVLRCQTGDEAAFTEIIERYNPRLRYYLRQMLREASHADDVLQEVWLAVFRKIARLSDPSAFAAWLYRIARSKASLSWRRERRERGAVEVDVADCAAEEVTFSRDEAEQIHAGLAQLEPEQREVLVLRFIEDMSYEEIARITGCPVGTVRSRLHYAKHALRRTMERMNHEC